MLIPADQIASAIYVIRGQRVMLDADLAPLYRVTVGRLNEAVKRNAERFPGDFMFQLSSEEAATLRSQIAILKLGRGQHRKYRPFAFTEQGVAMLSSVLRSARAARVNVEIMRAFVRLRALVGADVQLARRIDQLEERYDGQFKVVFDAIRQMMRPVETGNPKQIGFRSTMHTPNPG